MKDIIKYIYSVKKEIKIVDVCKWCYENNKLEELKEYQNLIIEIVKEHNKLLKELKKPFIAFQ